MTQEFDEALTVSPEPAGLDSELMARLAVEAPEVYAAIVGDALPDLKAQDARRQGDAQAIAQALYLGPSQAAPTNVEREVARVRGFKPANVPDVKLAPGEKLPDPEWPVQQRMIGVYLARRDTIVEREQFVEVRIWTPGLHVPRFKYGGTKEYMPTKRR